MHGFQMTCASVTGSSINSQLIGQCGMNPVYCFFVVGVVAVLVRIVVLEGSWFGGRCACRPVLGVLGVSARNVFAAAGMYGGDV